MMHLVKPGRYRHFKGQEYRVIGVGKHTESLEDLVFYQALYGDNGLWARPVDMFNDKVTVGKETVARFEYLGP